MRDHLVLDYETRTSSWDGRPKPCGTCYESIEAAAKPSACRRLALSRYSSPELPKEAQDAADSPPTPHSPTSSGYSRARRPLGQIVETSLYRFFLLGTLPETDEVRAVARRYLSASIEMAGMMERFIENWRPDVVVLHAASTSSATSLAVAESRGVRRVVWDVGYRRSSVLASHKGSYVRELRLDASASWDEAAHARESRALDIYLDGRQWGAMDGLTHHPSPVEGREAVLAATGLREGERLVSLFTNVVWDARVYAPETLFHGPVEWMLESMRHVAATPGVRYVIRIHPAEVKIPTCSPRNAWTTRSAPPSRSCRTTSSCIPPEDDLSSYSLAAASDLAVVYSSTIGLETMAMGVPTVVAGDPFYSGKGLGMEPPDQTTYYQLITHPASADRWPRMRWSGHGAMRTTSSSAA